MTVQRIPEDLIRVIADKVVDDIDMRFSNLNLYADHDGETSTPGYAAAIGLHASNGARLGTIAADGVHNHMGFYSRKYPMSSPKGKTIKRLNIQGGDVTDVGGQMLADTNVRFYSQHDNILKQSAEAGGIAAHDFISDGKTYVRQQYNPSTGHYEIGNPISGDTLLSIDPHNKQMAFGVDIPGLGTIPEVQDPSPDVLPEGKAVFDTVNERLIYTSEQTGESHWFRACGKL